MLSFVGNLQTAFRSGRAVLNSHHLRVREIVPTRTPAGLGAGACAATSHLPVPRTCAVGVFICIFAIHGSPLTRCLFGSLAYVPLGCFFSYYRASVLRVPFRQVRVLQTFPPTPRLVFRLLNSLLGRTGVSDFDELGLTNFFFYCTF